MFKLIKSSLYLLLFILLLGCSSTSVQPHKIITCELNDIVFNAQNSFCSSPRVSLVNKNHLILGFDNGMIGEWDLSSGKLVKKFEINDDYTLRSVAVTQDNIYFGSTDMKLKKYSFDGSLLEETNYEKGSIFSLARYKDKFLVGFGNSEIGLVNVKDFKLLKSYRKHDYLVYTLFIDKQNNLLYSGSDDNTIIVWKISEDGFLNKIKRIHGFELSVRHILKMDDGNFVITTGSGKVIVYDKTMSNLLDQYNEHTGIVLSAKVEGNQLITGDSNGMLVYWTYNNNKLNVIKKYKMDSSIRIIEILPDKIMAISKFGQVLNIPKSNL